MSVDAIAKLAQYAVSLVADPLFDSWSWIAESQDPSDVTRALRLHVGHGLRATLNLERSSSSVNLRKSLGSIEHRRPSSLLPLSGI